MSNLDDNTIKYRIMELRRKVPENQIAAIIGYIRNGAKDEQIYLLSNVNIQDILLIREAIKRNLI